MLSRSRSLHSKEPSLNQPATPPKVFISHASEDKERFARPFAAALRAKGVDAWFDEWEMLAGDSLVSKIFKEGISPSDAFVIVLSNISVTKPWVREELDSGMVHKITSEKRVRLIPVLLEASVEVPAAVRHLLWQNADGETVEHVAQRVADAVFGRAAKPPVGRPAPYLSTPLRWAQDPVDEALFNLVVEAWREHDGPWILWSNQIQAQALELGIDAEQFYESMRVLTASRLISAVPMDGGVRWKLTPLPGHRWLRLEQDRGVDVEQLRLQLLATLVNEGRSEFTVDELGLGFHTLSALLQDLQNQDLVHARIGNDHKKVLVQHIGPLARRVLRQLS